MGLPCPYKNFHKDLKSCLRDICQIVKNAPSHNVEESFKTFLDTDVDAEDFQNLINSSLSIDTSLVIFFINIRLVFFMRSCQQTNKKSNRMTNDKQNVTYLQRK